MRLHRALVIALLALANTVHAASPEAPDPARLDTKLKAHAIEVPFPQRDLHLRSGFESLQITG